MTDMQHDHILIGFRRGCVACAQTEVDFTRARQSNRSKNAVGEALWEQAMDGDPSAIADYSHWESTSYESQAGLHLSTPV